MLMFVSVGVRVQFMFYSEFFNEVFFFYLLVSYTGIVLNSLLLHSYWCLDRFNFLFSEILMLLLWSDILVLRACVDPMYTSVNTMQLLHMNF